MHIYDGPVVFDDDIACVTNAAVCKYCICCVVFGLWLVLVVFCCCVEQAAMMRVHVLANWCACVHVCMCAYEFLVCCFNRRAFVHIYDGPVVFDDDIAYVTNAAGSKYGICCVAFGLWLVLVVFCSLKKGNSWGH